MSTIDRQCSREAAFFHAQEGPMFSGLRSNSMAMSYIWLGLPGGCFQSDGGLRITAATASFAAASGALCAIWPKNLNCLSVTLTSALLCDERKGSLGSCGDPMYQMHLSGHTSTLLWPKFYAHASGPEAGSIYVLYSVQPIKMSCVVLAWLSVWSKVQIVCVWSRCDCKPHRLLPH